MTEPSLRIALVTWSHDTYQGISRCVIELAKRLSARHRVDVFAADVHSSAPSEYQLHHIPPITGRRHIRDWEFFYLAGRRLRRESFDLVHLHFPIWYPAQIFTSHGVPSEGLRIVRRLPAGPRRDVAMGRMIPFYTQIPLYSYHLRNRNRTLVSVSEKVRHEIVRGYGRNPEEIRVIPNGVDLECFHPGLRAACRCRLRRELGIEEDRFVLLFVGNQFALKGLRHAIALLGHLPDRAVLVVLGKDSPNAVPDLRPEIAGLVERRKLHFCGVRYDVERYYGASDALLVPSLYESFGLTVLEAMAAGVPVATSRHVAAGDEWIEDGRNGLLVSHPWEYEGMAARVSRLMTDGALYRRISAASRATAERFSWDRYATATEDLYKSLDRLTGGPDHAPRPKRNDE